MSDSPLPVYVDARKVFLQRGELAGSVELERLPRFRESLASDAGAVRVRLRFASDESKQRLIQGSLSATVEVICQRCLEAIAIELTDEINLALVADEQAAQDLEDALDPWLCADARLDLAQLVEEQLMLCMPIVNYHPGDSCLDQLAFADPVAGTATEQASAADENPFSVLKALKK